MATVTNHINGNKIYIVSYDFANDKLRRKVDKTLKNYGTRLQRSVFNCNLNVDQIEELSNKLSVLIDKFQANRKPEDSLIIIGEWTMEKYKYLVGKGCHTSSFMII